MTEVMIRPTDDPRQAGQSASLTLWLVRLGWLVIVSYTVYLFVITAGPRIDMLNRLALIHEPTLEEIGLTTTFMRNYLIMLDAVMFASFGLVGMIVFLRRYDDIYSIFSSAMMIMLGAALARPFEILTDSRAPMYFQLVLLVALVTSTIIYFIYSFPDGRFTPYWLRWVALGWMLWSFIWNLGPLLPWFFNLTGPSRQPLLTFLGWMGGGLVAAVYRYRKVFTPTQRQQTKWVLYGTTIAATGFLLHLYLIPMFFPIVRVPSQARLAYEMLSVLMLYVTMMAFPVTIAISILRFRLWDIDLIIRRTLAYTLVTSLLTVVYFGLIAGMQQLIFEPMGRVPVIAVALSTLAVSLLFTPLRRGAQNFIDRRFLRQRYDDAQLLASVGEALQHSLDLNEISEKVLSAVKHTLYPVDIGLWLYPMDSQDKLTHSDSIYCADFEPQFITQLNQAHRPIEIAELPGATRSSALLAAVGAQLIVPMFSQGETVGLMYLGPRRSEQDYNAFDRRTLETLANQVAPTLRAAQLAMQQRQAALEQQKMETELRMGRDVQRTLLAQEIPSMPGWQTATHYQPARAVGGDFYDVLSLDAHHVGIVLGDVSDKGVPAALVMAASRTLLRTLARSSASPGEVLHQVNNLLLEDTPQGMFITCLYAVLDLETGWMTYANAGQNLPFLCMGEDTVQLWARGMPLGLMADMEYEENRLQIPPGGWVLFYSDGLVEAHNPTGEMFGGPRICARLPQLTGSRSRIQSLLEDLNGFTGPDHQQEDDITLMILQRQPANEGVL